MNRYHGILLSLLLFNSIPTETFGDDRPTNPGIGPNTKEALSYQAQDYKFLVLLSGEAPAGFEQPGFDDSAFSTGTGAFGSGGNCPLQTSVQTQWPTDTQLLIRREIDIPPGATNVRILASVDNDIVDVFFNGRSISGPIVHEDCPVPDEFRIDVPQLLIKPGKNLVAFTILDRGVESFFDARILYDELPEIVTRVMISAADSDTPSHIVSCVPTSVQGVRVAIDEFVQGEVANSDTLSLPQRVEPGATIGTALCALEQEDQFPGRQVVQIGELMEPVGASTCMAVQVTVRNDDGGRISRFADLGCSKDRADIRSVFGAIQGMTAAGPVIVASWVKAVSVGVGILFEGIQAVAAIVELMDRPTPVSPPVTSPPPRGPIIIPCPETGCSQPMLPLPPTPMAP